MIPPALLVDHSEQKCQDLMSNEDILQEAQIPSIESILLKQQLHWSRNVVRMVDSCMPKAVLVGELKAGKRNRSPKNHSRNS